MQARLCGLVMFLAAAHAAFVSQTLTDTSAKCLDGTTGSFWIKTGSSSNWLIVFEGGGWCYSGGDCNARAVLPLGTNNYVVSLGTTNMNGPFSENCEVNPEFCNNNIVELHYCDGFSFLGDANITYGGVTRYSRGRVILKASLDLLLTSHGLKSATKVLLAGCSAGGTSALVNADYVRDYLTPNITALQTYKVLALSPIFPISIPNINSTAVFADQIQAAYSLAGASANVDSTCATALGSSNKWKCATGEGIYPYVTSPVMVVGSTYDKWMTSCIFAAGAVTNTSTKNGDCSAFTSWQTCLGPNTDTNTASFTQNFYDLFTLFLYSPKQCTSDQVSTLNTKWRDPYLSIVQSSPTYSATGNGAFLHSCAEHCGSLWDADYAAFNTAVGMTVDTYNSIRVESTTAYKAITKWWASSDDDASEHTYTPCEWSTGGGNTPQCNPTCPYGERSRLGDGSKAGIAIGAVAGVFFVAVAGALLGKIVVKPKTV